MYARTESELPSIIISKTSLDDLQKLDNENVEDNDFMMMLAEEELEHIDRSFTAGTMNAFGVSVKEADVLKQIDHIGQLQIRAFLNSMEIELKYQNLFDEDSFRQDDDEISLLTTPPSPTDNKRRVYKKKRSDSYRDFEDNEKFTKATNAYHEKEKVLAQLVNDLQVISQSINDLNKEMGSNVDPEVNKKQ
jgi:hypothetical protein